jgi:hypothetical protein
VERFGRPLSIYTDKASHFQTTTKRRRDDRGVDKDPVEMLPTQIGRALRELGITWIGAPSPQAKGRVERNFGTAQDRLVKGMWVAGVKTIEQANQYLTEVANVRVEQRLGGSLAVRYGERYLPIEECVVAIQPKKATYPDKLAQTPRTRKRGSDWNQNFNLHKAPKVGQAAQASGYRKAAESCDAIGNRPEVEPRQSSPSTGKRSARPAGSRGIVSLKERLRRSLNCHSTRLGEVGRIVFRPDHHALRILHKVIGNIRAERRVATPRAGPLHVR